MKPFLIMVAMVAVLAGSCIYLSVMDAQVYYGTPQPENLAKAKLPRYLLVHRYWSQSGKMTSDGGNISVGPGWTVLTEWYHTLDEVTDRMESANIDEDELVGLWDISKAPQVKIKTWIETKTIPERIEERVTKTRRWTIQAPDKEPEK